MSSTPGQTLWTSYQYDPIKPITTAKDHDGYDDLYRLTTSEGRWTQPDTEHTFTLAMAYDNIHNITTKTQSHLRLSDEGDWIRQHKTTYDFAYAYGGPQPHAPTHIGGRSYTGSGVKSFNQVQSQGGVVRSTGGIHTVF